MKARQAVSASIAGLAILAALVAGAGQTQASSLLSPVWTAEANRAGASFGRSVASAGDVNRDGFADVIVG